MRFFIHTPFILIIFVGLAIKSALANTNLDVCFDDAGKRYDIEPSLLKAIATQESSLNPSAFNQVGDVGLMQINPFWFSKLKKYGIDPDTLKDACVNANVGAWILAQNFHQFGRSWQAVGIYHAGTSKDSAVKRRADQYIKKIQRHYYRLKQRE